VRVGFYIGCGPTRSFGTGHFRRCTRLAAASGAECLVVVDPPEGIPPVADLPANVRILPGGRIEDLRAFRPDVIVHDRRDSSPRLMLSLRSIAPVVTLDDHGPGKAYAEFTVDAFPRPPSTRLAANLEGPEHLVLDPPKRGTADPGRPVRNVLVYLGGAERAESFERELLDPLLRTPGLRVKLFTPRPRPIPSPGPTRLEVAALRSSIRDEIENADLVISYVGLTLFEAALAGVPTAFFSPTAYHDRLARQLSFAFPIGKRGDGNARIERRIALLLDDHEGRRNRARSFAVRPEGARTIIGLARGIAAARRFARCPACGCDRHRAVGRRPAVTFFRCPRCSLLFLQRSGPFALDYGRDYFEEEYRAQYGKTYAEDRENIDRLNGERLSILRRMLPVGASTLDVGCALGFFVDIARQQGFRARGIEPSAHAVEHASKKLGVDVRKGTLATHDEPARSLDAVTLWYVLEHLPDPAMLARAIEWLVPGGVLALATPSSRGPAYRRNPEAYYDRYPKDHEVFFSPGSIRAFLRRLGLRGVRIRSTGIHPERSRLGRLLGPLYTPLARLFRLGDTMEVYARRSGR
jgi:spore coat polysaccharide biosynthesis predicted glycosyltransferase SpsG